MQDLREQQACCEQLRQQVAERDVALTERRDAAARGVATADRAEAEAALLLQRTELLQAQLRDSHDARTRLQQQVCV